DLLAAGKSVDMVFSDVMLPGDIDGLGLAKTIGKRYPQIPVLLTSGYAKALSGQHGMPILRKPYQISARAEAVRSTLEGAVTSRSSSRQIVGFRPWREG